MAQTQYNRNIRKLVVGFGNLFNDITLVRYNKDQTEAERMIVPIVYANKELYVRRLEEDYNADKKVQVTLPRMSFEMTGLTYDSSRKQNTNLKNFATKNGAVLSQYTPVPYNFDFSLYVYVRNIEDGTQIIEHILPYFTPDYTIKLNMVPEMGITKDIAIILNSATSDIAYEGDRGSDTRMIVWTLTFTVKGYVYGKSTETGLIEHAITSIYEQIKPTDVFKFDIDASTGVGDYQIGEVVYQGYSRATSTATAKVVSWDRNKLELQSINGNFVSTQPIYGLNTNANYKYTSHNLVAHKVAQIDAVAGATPAVKTDANTFTMDSTTGQHMDGVNNQTVTIREF
jgi:hypothetical protein